MKNTYCILALLMLVGIYNSQAQNPNWVMPDGFFKPGPGGYLPLPQSPNGETDPDLAYQGEPASYSSGGYTGPDGKLLFFVVDENVYDKNGWLIGKMNSINNAQDQHRRAAYSELLILPMGNSCTKFAIIFASTAENLTDPVGRYQTSSRMKIYMAIYDIDAESNYSGQPLSTGALIGEGSFGNGQTLTDISHRDGVAHYAPFAPYIGLYGYNQTQNQSTYNKGYQIAASALIDNCFHYVFISDGEFLIRYKLTSVDLEFDNYWYAINGASTGAMRSEMELTTNSNGNFRIAVPVQAPVGIKIFDFNQNVEIIPSSAQHIDLYINNSVDPAEPYGLEFDATGRYLYFTHKTNSLLPNPLDIWDVQTSSYVTPPTLPSTVAQYNLSYIERYGEDLYLAKSNSIAQIPNATTIGAGFDANFLGISSGYGNDAYLGATRLRYQLPEQVDNGTYGVFDSFSCQCCTRWGSGIQSFESTGTQTWTANENPINGGTSSEVRISGELRIKAGTFITISNMTFKFGPEARVVIEAGNATQNGGVLRLINTTIFTANTACGSQQYQNCDPIPNLVGNCNRDFWQGVVVLGDVNQQQSVSLNTRQGRLFMESNSMIEYARTGILVGDLSNNSLGGGVVRLKNSRMKDNIKGVHFAPYTRMSGSTELATLSDIRQMHFYTTADYLGMPQNNLQSFVHVQGISGLFLYDNLYENQIPQLFAPYQRGTGIYTTNSRVQESWLCTGTLLEGCPGGTINRSEFRNLTFGINGFNSSSNRTVNVYHVIFNENKYGINLTNFINPRILDNTFNVRRENNSFGLWMTSSTGYIVENNSFQQGIGTGFVWTFGIILQSSGTAYNQIYRNSFRDITNGVYSQGQNATTTGQLVGLVYECNTFSKPIRYGDITVNTGTISVNQGICPNPASNFFSHSSSDFNNHYDIKVHPEGVDPNFVIRYRHHNPTFAWQQRLVPQRYTGVLTGEPTHVLLTNCGNTYDAQYECLIRNTSLPVAQSGIIGEDNGEMNTSYIHFYASALEENIASAESYLDGGNTLLILEMIASEADQSEINALVQEAGESISQTVLLALEQTGNTELQELAFSTLSEIAGGSGLEQEGDLSAMLTGVELASFTIENDWNQYRKERDELWNNVVSFVQNDTLGVISSDEVFSLLNEYQPSVAQRYASAFAVEHNLTQPEWIEPYNNATYTQYSLASLPVAGSDEGLPFDIPEHFETSFFDFYGNTSELNALYISQGAVYNNYIIPFVGYGEEIVEEGKSKPVEKPIADNGKFIIQPNPFNDYVQFVLSDHSLQFERIKIEIYDLMGRQVWSQYFAEGASSLQIDGNKLSTGLLTYVIYVDDKPLQKGKIVGLK